MAPFGLYLHIPFCAAKCPYCDFCSEVLPASGAGGYVAAVETEIARAVREPEVSALIAGGQAASLFVGGGTPTHLPAPDLVRLFAALEKHFPIAPAAEITVECNPESLDGEKVAVLRELRVNRVSLGVQSLDDRVLVRLGRPHDAGQAYRAARLARERFPRVSYDLILGVPGGGPASLARTLDRLLELAPDHLSAYGLTVEPGTPFGAARARGDFSEASDDEHLVEDSMTEERAEQAGLRRYEVSSYARPGAECQHNLAVWQAGFYLGFGPSAASYVPAGPYGTRRTNVADLAAYRAFLAEGRSPVSTVEPLTRRQAMIEALLVGLRLTEGVDKRAFARRFGVSLAAAAAGALAPLVDGDLVIEDDAHVRTTRRGRQLLDSVVEHLCEAIVAE